jgi:hypothetical protein
MSANTARGLPIKHSLDGLAGALCRAFTLMRQRVSNGGEIRQSTQQGQQLGGPMHAAVRVGSSSSYRDWPARHPAELALLLKQARTHRQRSRCQAWRR